MPHIHEAIDFCSETYIVFNNTILLRKHDKLKRWLSVGGHIELNEDPAEAAIREVKEEVGLDVELYSEPGRHPTFRGWGRSIIPPLYLNRHRVSEHHEHIACIYFAKAETSELKLSQREITDGCHWFTKKELSNKTLDITEDVRWYALKALEVLHSNNRS